MALTPIGSSPGWPTSAPDSAGVHGPQTSQQPGEAFGSVIESLIERANDPQMQADQAFQSLVTGQTNNIHDVVMSVVKADMTFRFALEMRNRLTDAYQEIMRMQV